MDIVRRIAVKYTSICFFLDLFNDLYHDQCHIHISLFIITVFGVNKLSQGHLCLVVSGKRLIFTWLTYSGWWASKLLYFLFSTHRAIFSRTDIFSKSRFICWASWTSNNATNNTAFNIFHNADCWLKARLVSSYSWLLNGFNLPLRCF